MNPASWQVLKSFVVKSYLDENKLKKYITNISLQKYFTSPAEESVSPFAHFAAQQTLVTDPAPVHFVFAGKFCAFVFVVAFCAAFFVVAFCAAIFVVSFRAAFFVVAFCAALFLVAFCAVFLWSHSAR